MGCDDRVEFPRSMPRTCRRGDVTRYRKWVVPRTGGRAFEVGVGAGLNPPLFCEKVTQVVGIDPNETLNRTINRMFNAEGFSHSDTRSADRGTPRILSCFSLGRASRRSRMAP